MLVTLVPIVTLVMLVQYSKERPIECPDAGDRQAIDRVGDGHRTARTGVFRDGDRAVIGRVVELGLHRGGQRSSKSRSQAAPKRVAIVFVQVVLAIEVCVFMLFDLFVFVSSLVSLMSAA